MPPAGIPSTIPQAGYGGAPVTGGTYGGAIQSVPRGMPGLMPQAPYAAAPLPAGAQVYPTGYTIVLPSRKKRRHRNRARSRDLEDRDRYYRERRYAADGYESY